MRKCKYCNSSWETSHSCTNPNQVPQEEWEREFDKLFVEEKVCRACLNAPCDYSTTGCPMSESFILYDKTNQVLPKPEIFKAFIRTHLSQAREQGRREGLEEEKKAWIDGKRCTSCGNVKEPDLADWCGKCFREN